jgi:hypothetical protein
VLAAVAVPFDPAELLAALAAAERTVGKYFPQHWRAVETLLAATATLLLGNVIPALALFVTGRSGSGKSTIIDMFSQVPLTGDKAQDELIRLLAMEAGAAQDSWIIARDRFTASSILSMYSDPRTKKKELEDRALFRAVKHKVLVTSELSRAFRAGTDHERVTLFSIIQQWLDGRGVCIDSGTHGTLGEKGDFSFVWVGGTTPFPLDTWKSMSALGPRLLFYRSRSIPLEERRVADGDDYGSALEECRQAVQRVLFILAKRRRRSMPWPKPSASQREVLYRYATLAVRAQTFPKIEPPDANHLHIRLSLLLAGRALLQGRSTLDESDMLLARHLARSTTPQRRGSILFALSDAVQAGESSVGTTELQQRTNLPHFWLLNILQEMKTSGIVQPIGPTKWALCAAQLRDDEDWE